MGSKLESAKRFKRWVTNEVLPCIRKNGAYITNELLYNPEILNNVVQTIKAQQNLHSELLYQNCEQKHLIKQIQPKADYCDRVLQSHSPLPITLIAKDYGFTAQSLNRFLKECGIQFKVGNTWVLKQKYADMGLTTTHTYEIEPNHTHIHTYWTEKGRKFIHDLLKSKGIIQYGEDKVGE